MDHLPRSCGISIPTRVRHYEVDLIPKSGVCTLSVYLQWSRIRSFGYQLHHMKTFVIEAFVWHLELSPLASMRFSVKPVGKLPISSVGFKVTTKRVSLGSLSVRHPHPKHVVSRQLR